MSAKKSCTIGITTGGGDCPGLNAVIRAVVKSAILKYGWNVIGVQDGFDGLIYPERSRPLTLNDVSGIMPRGGTILGTTNRGNPFKYKTVKNGKEVLRDVSDKLLSNARAMGLDALIVVGGDGTQRIALDLQRKGLNIVGVPKTIDNDLSATEITFGFDTALHTATDAIDKIHTTAESHHRIMVVEVMGRDAGWIALHTAIAGGAEICLIPEIPYDVEKIMKRIHARYKKGRGFVNIVIAEGAKPKAGGVTSQKGEKGSEHVRLGGVAFQLSKQLKDAGCRAEIRETVLGHVVRGGSPVAFDRVLATLFGVKAFELVLEKKFGHMVNYKNNTIDFVTLEEATKSQSLVSKDSYLVKAAKGLSISFGD
jgi:6-phosphofructokinase 1